MKINREELYTVLEKVRAGLPAKEIVEAMTNFTFTGEDVITYNDDICIHHPYETDFSGSIKADKLLKLLAKEKSDEYDTQFDDNYLTLTSGDTEIKIPVTVEKEILNMAGVVAADFSGETEFEALPDNFLEGLELTNFSVGTNASKLALTCAWVYGSHIYTADMVRGSRFSMNEEMPEMLIKGKSVTELLKYKNLVGYKVGERWVHFVNEEQVFFSVRLVLGCEFPDSVRDLFDAKSETVLNFTDDVRLKIKEAIGLSSIVATEKDSEGSRHITLEVLETYIKCTGSGKDWSVKKRIPVEFGLTVEPINIHPVFLNEVLERASELNIFDNRVIFNSDNFSHIIMLVGG